MIELDALGADEVVVGVGVLDGLSASIYVVLSPSAPMMLK